jgi:threonine/homoserine/homoserine lactone efflux protein
MDALLSSLPSALWAFALAAFIIELTPGPNMTYLAIVSVSKGWRAGFATVVGVALGLAVLGVIGAFGVATLIQSSDTLYEALRWTGVVYLFWLAYEGWRGNEADIDRPGDTRNFMRGLVTNLLNPKAAVFYVAVLPNFTDADKPVLAQSLILSAVYVAIATVVHGLIVLLGGSLASLLTNPVRETLIRRILSVLLALVAIWFAWSTAR